MVAHGLGMGLPLELQKVRGKVLEDYVQSRILDFALEQSFAKRLYASPSRVFTAAKEALAELSRPNDGGHGRDLRLVFRHTCLRCASTFAPKYLSGDALKAKCGAPIFVEVLDARGQAVGQESVKGLHLEICILEGKAFSEADPESITDSFLDANTLLTDSKGKEVLGPGKDCERTEDKRVIARFNDGRAELSVNILGSSIAMLTGQKPPFRLLVRAIDSDTRRRSKGVSWAVSDAFVVATQRVKGAQKAEIPHVEEHVSKIENVGVQTQHKLQDIKAAASTAGVSGINVVHNSVQTVGQFKELVESTAKDMPLQETLRKVLNFTSKGWDAAKAHALKAVETDNRMRIWLADDSHTSGLLFRCNLGRVDLDAPVGLLSQNSNTQASTSGQVELEAIHVQHPSFNRQTASWLQQKALECWWKPGHPGWSIWPADSEQFIRGVVEARPVNTTPVEITANVPSTPHMTNTMNLGILSEDAILRSGSDFAGSSQALTLSNLAHGSQNQQQDSASFGTQSLAQPQVDHRSQAGNFRPNRPQFMSPVKNEVRVNSESGPSGSSLNTIKAQSANSQHQSSGPSQGVSWPFNVPLVNAQTMGRKAQHLPASPFDIPVSATVSSSNPANISASTNMQGFSFRPPSTSKPGLPIGPLNTSVDRLSILHSLTTQDFDQLIEFQRRLNSGMSANESTTHSPLNYFNTLSNEYQNSGGEGFPQIMSRISGLISDPNFANILESRSQLQGGQQLGNFNPYNLSQKPPNMGEGDQQMPLKISGKVSGILDDLSDAMSLLHELLPSANSDIHLQAQAAKASENDVRWPSNNSLSLFNIPSGLPPIENPQMPMLSSAEGSNGPKNSQNQTSVGLALNNFDTLQPPAKRIRSTLTP